MNTQVWGSNTIWQKIQDIFDHADASVLRPEWLEATKTDLDATETENSSDFHIHGSIKKPFQS